MTAKRKQAGGAPLARKRTPTAAAAAAVGVRGACTGRQGGPAPRPGDRRRALARGRGRRPLVDGPRARTRAPRAARSDQPRVATSVRYPVLTQGKQL
jgi:hypothetical protein